MTLGGDGSAAIQFSGSTNNDYTGTTYVSSGTVLQLAKSSSGVPAVAGPLDISGTVRPLGHYMIANSSDVTVEASGQLQMGGYVADINGLSGSGPVDLGSGWVAIGYNNGSSTYSGVMSGAGSLYKYGSGTISLTGANTYTGITHVLAGMLIVNGSQPASALDVTYSGALGGTGTVGPLGCAGDLMFGASPGILTCSNLTLTSWAAYFVVLNGPNPGTGYTQLNVRGTNNLANAVLVLHLGLVSPLAKGQQFTIINNDGTDPITGTFVGLAEGAITNVSGYSFAISYVGGTGNDVVLTVVDVPGAAVSSSVTSGNGNHGIDPNECNQLNLAITNRSVGSMTGVNATLSTTTPGVLITQPYSAYPNMAASGQATNLTPFQISTLPGFICGTDINLQLTVTSSWGPFTMNFVQHSGEPTTSPIRYANYTATPIPDVGTVDSSVYVFSDTVGPLSKVAVALYLTHTYDADLTISLIGPDGTTVVLSSGNGGGGANYGSGSADAALTWFDDAASTSITSGTAPFVGTFRPQQPLSAFIGKTGTALVGAWRLRVTDANGGSLGTLRDWTLIPYGTVCASGSGACDYCLTAVTNSIASTDSTQAGRIVNNGILASCGAPKPCPGAADATARHYDVYAFTNTTASDACVTTLLTSSCDVQAVIYVNAFNPANITNNYAADSGASTANGAASPQSCSASIPAGAKLFVVVNEVTANAGCGSYTLQVSGLPCPQPTLVIAPAVPTGSVRLHWPSWAGGYNLETSSAVKAGVWATCPNEPMVSAGRCNVTNTCVTAPEVFYRLHKP